MPRATIRGNPEAILKLRTMRGLSQKEVADRAGISKKQYERIESGDPTTLDTLSYVAAVLICPIPELIDASELQAEAKRLGVTPQQLVAYHTKKKKLAKWMRGAILSTLI